MGLTACIYTKNNEHVVEEALKSVRFADEVILLDSGSTDGTVEIGRRLADRVEHRAWTGFCDQLNHIPTLASHDWLLIVDADERVTEALAREIAEALKNPGATVAFKLPRQTLYMGRWLRHGEFYPDYTLRLYRKGCGRYEGEPHAKLMPAGPVGWLQEPLRHHMQRHLGDQIDTMRRYSESQAREMFRGGLKRARLRALIHPIQRFIKGYVIKGGFLDGWPGFVAAATASFHVFLKYVRVEEMSGEC